MQQIVIFYPVLGMMLLTFAVWIYLYFTRLTFLIGNDIDPDSVNSPAKMAEAIPEHINRPSENFKNLFELPVLFYVVCIILFVTESVDTTYLYLATGFLAFRSVHSLVHCTYNRVIHRFSSYIVASLFFWAMLIRMAIQVMERSL